MEQNYNCSFKCFEAVTAEERNKIIEDYNVIVEDLSSVNDQNSHLTGLITVCLLKNVDLEKLFTRRFLFLKGKSYS